MTACHWANRWWWWWWWWWWWRRWWRRRRQWRWLWIGRERRWIRKKNLIFFLSKSITHTQVLLNIIKVLNGHMLEVQSHYSSTHIQCKLIKFIHQATCLRVVWRRTRFSPTGRGHGSVTTGRGRSARGGDRGGGEHHSHCSSRASTKVPVSTWPHWQRHCAKPIQESGRLANTTPNW